MLLAFQASAFDRSATCPETRRLLNNRGLHAVRIIAICYCGFGGSAAVGVAPFGLALGLAKGGGMSRQGSSLPRMRSGVLSGGTLSELRVLGVSRPAGACSGGISRAPA